MDIDSDTLLPTGSERPRYGALALGPDEHTVEFRVEGTLQRTWSYRPERESVDDAMRRCLVTLTHDGWRPISHADDAVGSVVLARVPYAAGAKLPVHGTLRYLDDGALVLAVSGAIMRRWDRADIAADDPIDRALTDLAGGGWRLLRRYPSGATVVRG